jgi:hypothetical protein
VRRLSKSAAQTGSGGEGASSRRLRAAIRLRLCECLVISPWRISEQKTRQRFTRPTTGKVRRQQHHAALRRRVANHPLLPFLSGLVANGAPEVH